MKEHRFLFHIDKLPQFFPLILSVSQSSTSPKALLVSLGANLRYSLFILAAYSHKLVVSLLSFPKLQPALIRFSGALKFKLNLNVI